MNVLILPMRSVRLGDFDWHVRALRERTTGTALVERFTNADALAARLDAIGRSAQPWHVHLLAETDHGRLVVAPGTYLDLDLDLGTRTAPAFATSDDVRLDVWVWNDRGPLPEALGDALRIRFGFRTSLDSLSALKVWLRGAAADASAKTRFDESPRPSRFVGLVAVAASLLTLWFGVYAVLSVLTMPWSLSTTDLLDPDVFDPAVHDPDRGDDGWSDPLEGEASRRWRASAGSESQGPGRPVRYRWEFAQRDWQAEWWILETWLRSADARLEQLALRPGRARYWEETYQELARDNDPQLRGVAEAFRAFVRRHELGRQATATLALRFVQSIHYRVPGNRLGILTPPRTLVERFGDCDTKSLLYALLLRQLGIDAAILLSDHYRHAMAGVALPGAGPHLKGSGRRYYFTETTNLGFPIGQIPNGLGNLSRWRLVELDTPVRAYPGPD